MEEREYSNVYAIPTNYTDSGKLLGGMLEVRNTIEAGLLVALVSTVVIFQYSSPSQKKEQCVFLGPDIPIFSVRNPLFD